MDGQRLVIWTLMFFVGMNVGGCGWKVYDQPGVDAIRLREVPGDTGGWRIERGRLAGPTRAANRLWVAGDGRTVIATSYGFHWYKTLKPLQREMGMLPLEGVDADSGVYVFDIESGWQRLRLDANAPLAAVSADGRRAVTLGGDGSLRAWELAWGRCIGEQKGERVLNGSLVISADGGVAVMQANDRPAGYEAICWDIDKGSAGRTKIRRPMGISPDKRIVMTINGCVELATGKALWKPPQGEYCGKVQFDATGQRVTLTDSCRCNVFDVYTGTHVQTMAGVGRYAAISRDGRWVISEDEHVEGDWCLQDGRTGIEAGRFHVMLPHETPTWLPDGSGFVAVNPQTWEVFRVRLPVGIGERGR